MKQAFPIRWALVAILIAAFATATPLRADQLNFDDITTFPNALGTLPDHYGSTAKLLISYASGTGVPNTPGYPQYPPFDYVYWWPQYNDLNSVIYSANPFGPMLITFTPAPGYEITLNSFDLGQDVGAADLVFALDVNPLRIEDTAGPGYTFIGAQTVTDVHTHFEPNYTSTGSITLVVGDNWNIGIDNIDYTVTAVPEPATISLFAAAGIGLFFRRRTSR